MLERIFRKKKRSFLPPIKNKGVIIILTSLLLLGSCVIIFVFVFHNFYKDKILPGTRIGQLELGGKTYEQAQQMLQEEMNKITDQGTTFSYKDEKFTIESTVEDSANPELSFRLFSLGVDETVKQLTQFSKSRNEAEYVFYWLAGRQTAPYFVVDEKKFIEALAEELAQYEQPAVDARLDISEEYVITVAPEKGGQAFNYPGIIAEVRHNLIHLSDRTIVVELEQDNPTITKTLAEPLVDLAEQILNSTPLTLLYGDRSWSITKEQIREWLQFQTDNGQITVGFREEGFTGYLEAIGNEVDVEVKEAKFSMENGKVAEFQPSQNGLSLQVEETADNIIQKIKLVGVTEIDLIVEETEPEMTTENVNNLGIKELIGEGRSNFRGSPRNRRHNIAVGADTLNGILIEPNEEFSLVKALGEIEASTGYLPELVIKGNKTIPEYGGGLCQIGTTTFRVALDAGLPITARTNHSYRVSYYEPAGTDATIYDPLPDFRFINDTGNHILFTTEISGNELIFRFYGTSDGRAVEQTKPRIFNLVKPGSTKLVETTDLAPGEKKCTERAHTGADAEFTRTITYANGEKKAEVFSSHYKPWQEVCLIGVEELSEETSE